MPQDAGLLAESFAERVGRLEADSLSPLAVRSYATRGRAVDEAECGVRTPFQRDRDRIVHSKPFRRLKHKTQVFIAPEATTSTAHDPHLEVTAFAGRRPGAPAERDLTEAIALGHDLGHPPFGHTGEEALDRCLRDHGSEFHHNEHSVRVVEVLERDGRGLNLTAEVRDGIRHHTGSGRPATLEGAIVRLVDRFGYVNHDIDDAVRAGILDAGDLPAEPLRLLGATSSARVDALVHDLVETSDHAGAIEQSRIRSSPLRAPPVHVRARLPRPAGAPRSAGRRRGRGSVPSPPDRLGSRGGD
jgi:dGTPase